MLRNIARVARPRIRSSTRRHPGGYGRVAAFAVVLAVVMALLAVAVNAIGRTRGASGRRDRQRAGEHPAGV